MTMTLTRDLPQADADVDLGADAPASPASPARQAQRQVDEDVGVVLIGRNEGQRFVRALDAVLRQVGDPSRVVYVDSGSKDGSPRHARDRGVTVVDLDLSTPFTAARARNEGFAALTEARPGLRFVQFLDGDCELDPGWLAAGRDTLLGDETLGVAAGRRREKFPERTVYNRLCDLEWRTKVGKTPGRRRRQPGPPRGLRAGRRLRPDAHRRRGARDVRAPPLRRLGHLQRRGLDEQPRRGHDPLRPVVATRLPLRLRLVRGLPEAPGQPQADLRPRGPQHAEVGRRPAAGVAGDHAHAGPDARRLVGRCWACCRWRSTRCWSPRSRCARCGARATTRARPCSTG